MPSQVQIRQEITARIVEALESNLLPWRRPWSVSPNAGRPANAVSKKAYSGINSLLLELHRLKHGLQSRWWGTFRQWSDAGCTVKKRPADVEPGKWGCGILFCKAIEKEIINDQGEQDKDKFFMLRYFTVFSADQVDGEGAERLQVRDELDGDAIPNFAPADELVAASGANVRHGGESAFYRRPVGSWPHHSDGDYITMPNKQRFSPAGSYYETLLHELAHWSEVRVGWEESYEMGELVAEMSASFLSSELGIPQAETMDNHAAYIKSWLKEMNNDPSFIFKASTQASKVSDYLLSFVQVDATEPAAIII